ncbi:MAG TPA: MFS transporter [Candidatus Nitrosocosmicus sp.]|nr:MFS transporter [Candidatus Nitrosocosmicus sp.]
MKERHQGIKGRVAGDKLLANNIKYYVLNGVLYTIVTNLYKPFAQKFIFRLEGSEFHVSLFNALPGMVAVFAIIPGIIFMSRAMSKKKVTGIFFFLSRLFVLSFAIVPFLPDQYKPMAFVLLAGFMNFPESVSTTALQNFAAEAFSEKDRAFAIASKNKYSALISFISLLVLGQIIERLGTTDSRAIIIYQLFFVAAFLLGIYEIAALMKIKENNAVKAERIDLRGSLTEIFRNKGFMKFMTCSLLFHFGWQMGWPLFSIYQIKYLGATEAWITISNVSSGIAMFMSYGFWERLITKKGNCYAIALATTGMAATPIMYAWSPNLYVLTVAGIIMGFFTSGTTTTILSSLLEAAPEKNRLMYVAVHATLTNITLSVAPLLGDFMLRHSNIYISLYIVALARFIGSTAFFVRDRYNKTIVNQMNKAM